MLFWTPRRNDTWWKWLLFLGPKWDRLPGLIGEFIPSLFISRELKGYPFSLTVQKQNFKRFLFTLDSRTVSRRALKEKHFSVRGKATDCSWSRPALASWVLCQSSCCGTMRRTCLSSGLLSRPCCPRSKTGQTYSFCPPAAHSQNEIRVKAVTQRCLRTHTYTHAN